MVQVQDNGGPAAVGYLRVSTAEQVADGVSLDMQEARIRAWCDSQDRKLVAVFSDPGAPPLRQPPRRPALGRARSAALARYGGLGDEAQVDTIYDVIYRDRGDDEVSEQEL
jgi:DNA invertase Pin-like site-specific DNA recombinase